eukprot:1157354-Pelagomonas_calceolata.AAC.3
MVLTKEQLCGYPCDHQLMAILAPLQLLIHGLQALAMKREASTCSVVLPAIQFPTLNTALQMMQAVCHGEGGKLELPLSRDQLGFIVLHDERVLSSILGVPFDRIAPIRDHESDSEGTAEAAQQNLVSCRVFRLLPCRGLVAAVPGEQATRA